MTCTGGRLAACPNWKVNRPSPVMSAVELNRCSGAFSLSLWSDSG